MARFPQVYRLAGGHALSVAVVWGLGVGTVLASDPVRAPGSPWQAGGEVHLLAGYTENATLSAVAPLDSAWVKGKVDSWVARAWKSGTRLHVMAAGEDTHYVGASSSLEDERLALGRVEVRHDFTRSLRLWVSGRGLWQQSVVDFSADEANPVVIPVRVVAPQVEAAGRFSFASCLRAEAGASLERRAFQGYQGTFREAKPWLKLAAQAGGWEMSLRAARGQRVFATRPNYTEGGRALEGTRARWSRPEARARVSWRHEGNVEWTLAAESWVQQVRDGFSGFFDYTRRGARLTASAKTGPWNAELELSHEQDRYRIQTVGTGIQPEARRSTQREATLSLQRRLGTRWSVLAEADTSASRSNLAEFSYTSRQVGLGLGFEF